MAAAAVTWDPFVRLFHWSLAGFFCLAYWLEGGWLLLHAHAGYSAALLVLFRLVWGFAGTPHARFADFVRGPRATLGYLRDLAGGRSRPYPGHDPAGAAMIVALLASVAATAGSGMALFAMEGRGPLAGTFVADWPGGLLERVHELCADLTLILVLAHITGVALMSVLHRENLVRAMISGRKRRGAGSA